MALPQSLLQAVRRYGPSVQGIADQYHISGAALLAKLVQGESGGSGTAVSNMGARGYAQFMPGSRQIAIKRYGVDPWADPDQAVHAAALHLRGKINGSTGLSGYNPGDPSYTGYILGQKVGDVGAGSGSRSGGGGGSRVGSSPASVTVTPGTAQNGFDPGPQSVGSLAGLLTQQAPPPVAIPQAPNAVIQSPVVAPPPVRGGLVDALAAIQTPAQGLPETQTSSPSVKVTGGGGAPRASAASATSSGRYATGRLGKIIGTPYAGTHTLGNWQSDNADDIAVPAGTPMVAVQDGTVVKVRHHPQDGGRFAGDQITIRGANGNEYFYAHGVADVRPGQRIRKGQSLGVTGSANGVEHLHYAQKRGNPIMHARPSR